VVNRFGLLSAIEGLGKDILLELRLPPYNRQNCTKRRRRGGGGMPKELTTGRGKMLVLYLGINLKIRWAYSS